ncbi:Arm DNA-binding domain-containing protein [uncultured Pontibacter sp.]|uniref:Arm DNA-binding domain-containing protein n=1 Tax=uncultured Pontibacter sp. TaxID=453356 RepID=UPI00262E97E8|nr:Arm DNA-binding domain-containing protein [uncultured Pontibacter sp.]
MDTRISILFYGRKAKTTRDNLVPIYLRVTLQGQRLELSTHRYVSPARWSAEAGKVKGSSAEARSVNAYLETLRTKAYGHHRELLEEGRPVTVE